MAAGNNKLLGGHMAAMNPVIHFEMPYVDEKRVTSFYAKAFGWSMANAGKEMSNYLVATTTESDDKGPKKPGTINGGFFVKSVDPGRQVPSVVISVDDVVDTMAKVKEAGGTIIGEPVDIPGIGKWVSLVDPEGNIVSMLQPSRD